MPSEAGERLTETPSAPLFYCKTFKFADLDTKIKAKLALEYAELIYEIRDIDPKSPWNSIRDLFTTAILRSCCGCENETYFDELLGEWKVMEGHDRGCHFARFPISEDYANSTIKRRGSKELLRDHQGLLQIEEARHACTT